MTSCIRLGLQFCPRGSLMRNLSPFIGMYYRASPSFCAQAGRCHSRLKSACNGLTPYHSGTVMMWRDVMTGRSRKHGPKHGWLRWGCGETLVWKAAYFLLQMSNGRRQSLTYLPHLLIKTIWQVKITSPEYRYHWLIEIFTRDKHAPYINNENIISSTFMPLAISCSFHRTEVSPQLRLSWEGSFPGRISECTASCVAREKYSAPNGTHIHHTHFPLCPRILTETPGFQSGP